MFGKSSNVAGYTALILSIMACALTTQSRAQETESLDAIERRLIEHYNIREGDVAMRDAPGWAPLRKIVVRDIQENCGARHLWSWLTGNYRSTTGVDIASGARG